KLLILSVFLLTTNSNASAAECNYSHDLRSGMEVKTQIEYKASAASITGYVATATVKNNHSCSVKTGLVSYLKYDEVIANQKLHDYKTVILDPGKSVSFTITAP